MERILSSNCKSVVLLLKSNERKPNLQWQKLLQKPRKPIMSPKKKKRVAAFEDELRREDKQEEKTMTRPDLSTQQVCAPFNVIYQ